MNAPPDQKKGGPSPEGRAAELNDLNTFSSVNDVDLAVEAGHLVPIVDGIAATAEAADDRDALLLDEMAAKLRASGCSAKAAPIYVARVVEILKARDKACVDGVLGFAAEVVEAPADRSRLGLIEFFRILEAEASRRGKPSKQQLFTTFLAAAHLAGAAFAQGSTRSLGALCGVSQEVLNRRVERIRARLRQLHRASAKSAAHCAALRAAARRRSNMVEAGS